MSIELVKELGCDAGKGEHAAFDAVFYFPSAVGGWLVGWFVLKKTQQSKLWVGLGDTSSCNFSHYLEG